MNAHPEAVLSALEKKLEAAVFWPKVEAGGNVDHWRQPKRGRGPRFSDSKSEAVAVEALSTLIASYVEADLRAQLYFKLPEGRGTAPDPSIRPLRADSEGNLVDPLILEQSYARPNPVWLTAPTEWGFDLQSGVLLLPDKSMNSLVRDLHLDTDGEFWFWDYEIARLSTVDRSKGHKYQIKREI